MLRVKIESAKGIPKKTLGNPDPFVTVIFCDEKKKTKHIDNEVNPIWNEDLEFDLKGQSLASSSVIDVVVKDYETIGKDKFIGSANISLKELGSGQIRSLPAKNISLLGDKKQDTGAVINLIIDYKPPANATSSANNSKDKESVAEEAGKEDDGGEGVDNVVDGGQLVPSGAAPLPGQPREPAWKVTRKRHRALVNKPQDFQLRIRVIEGRQLAGNRIKPVVKVNVCGQTHRTRIKRGNNPFFDEIFFYNVNMLPSELFDEYVILRVYNSYSVRADSLIGEFKMDIGYVYDEPAHAIMRKWLLLSDADDLSSGARGYLKVSMMIVGTGDEPPVEKSDRNEDQDDVEKNLLRPAGVSLRSATLTLKVYRAEDMPQMDDAIAQTVKHIFGGVANYKNLVDPFLEVSFAGKKLRTKIIKKNANPEWNQLINLQIKLPSMCERIKLTVYDWDCLTENDTIGTTYLNLSQIASSGEEIEELHAEDDTDATSSVDLPEAHVGFLPAFGPCYLNLYGSPREYSGLPDAYEELNHGKGEGVAYRGRILVELTSQLDGKPEKKVEEIPRDYILVAQKYQRRRKYSLCAVFHSACMLQEPGEPIQFEVSIGNYGNKLDTTYKPLSSTTQYSCAVFDGNHYHYLPWASTKPVVILTSYWEDISHRLDSVNIILYIAERLHSNLTSLKTAILAKASDTRLAEIWLKLINYLMEDLSSCHMPELEGKPNLTTLDLQLKMLRNSTITSIREAAKRMKEGATDIRTTIADIEDWLNHLMQISEEPQNSIPDVIIWMLRGERRVAYARIPAHQVLHSTYSDKAMGKQCGKTQTIFMKYPMDKKKGATIPVQLRVNMWLGLSAHEETFNSFAEGTFTVYAEMYENQAKVGKWGTAGLVGRHKCSDVTGKVKLKQEYFMPPRGWQWEGDWFVDPERSLLTEADAGHTEFTDEVFQNEVRFPGVEWKPAPEPFTDVNGEKAQSPEAFECPPGWTWGDDDWDFDHNRAVDENGWEYGLTIPPDDKPRSWVSTEKMYHMHRRKRLIRHRKKISDMPIKAMKAESGEGWEYSSLIGWKFHSKERSSDTFRRRRWRRKMAPSGSIGACAIFKLEGAMGVDVDEKASKKDTAKQFGASTPMVSCSFDRSFIFHLRVYVYQARNLLAMDKDSFSDPYVHVSFLHVSKTTETITGTLNPTWDQTLIFDNVEIYGNPKSIAHYPPSVVLELYDRDQVGKDEPMGRCLCLPVVNLNPAVPVTPRLLWYPITLKGKSAGEMLVASELLLKNKSDDTELPIVPSRKDGKFYMVPQGIRPVVQLTAIEILTWGLRNIKSYQLAAVSSPSLIVECGGQVVQTGVIKNMKRNPNFPGSVLFMKVLLPKVDMYTPPIMLKVIDHRPFGRKPIVGQCTIDSLDEFRRAENTEVAWSAKVSILSTGLEDVILDIEKTQTVFNTKTIAEEDSVDWWSKFYSSIGESEKCGPYLQKGFNTLMVYHSELEEVPEFQGLTDFCSTFKLQRGKTEDEDDDPTVVGEFKGSFRVYPLSDDPNISPPPRQFRELPDSTPQDCLIRIYIVRCIDLQPKDNNGLCDPYIKISLGKHSVEDREHYKPNTLNPEFGRMFELSCFLPQDKDLNISIYDYDLLSRDEKVGETVIDLENRLFSRYRSSCGLPESYCVSGINQWRDQLRPSQILQNLARLKGIPPPQIENNGSSLSFAGKMYSLLDFEASKMIHQHLGPPKERICLHVLKTQGLVPEHVETRTLYSTYQPTLPQGRIQMWVDIFPKSLGTPSPPFDIRPRKARRYFLRAIIWNTSEVILDETSITGENMSDIYVKGWMLGMEEDKQKTDVHYRSLDGDGNFNWRFVFGFDYLPTEQLCIVSKKEHFWNLDKTQLRIPPKLIIQIWDNDKFSLDDYLGSLELDLLRLIPPAKNPEKCTLDMLPDMAGNSNSESSRHNSLFAQKSVRGWWPCKMEQDGKQVLTGKVEMTLEVVDDHFAEERPAGKGRDEPNMNPKLDPPNRPEMSFFWFTSPCKTMKYIMWRRFKWLFIKIIILLIVLLFLAILLYSLPNYISMKIVKPF
ncbi:hypothetical protein AALO_G00239370 [Alosa alosa]|uniref:C2 domain-containing protein n=1 Tax=Alosa alosa TaxID=278164 RepID=A0AAV6G396_9TELE|nr:myoferlin-like isoform X1 [Alosa alosa]KAG5267056.1 hypothetical protein AALO_G00239370 [Alosa alosa]